MVGLGSAPDLDGGVAVAVPDLSLADDGVDGGGVVGGGLGADAVGVKDDDAEEDEDAAGLVQGVAGVEGDGGHPSLSRGESTHSTPTRLTGISKTCVERQWRIQSSYGGSIGK